MHFFGKGNLQDEQKGKLGLRGFFVSTEFKTGINFVKGGLYQCGGLSFALCKGQEGMDYDCKGFYLNGTLTTPKQMHQLTYHVTAHDKLHLGSWREKTVIQHLKIAEKTKGADIKLIKHQFILADGNIENNSWPRSHRKLSQLSGCMHLYSCAIGFAYGKKIFCFPWLCESLLKSQVAYFSALSLLAEEHDLIFIIPVESTKPFEGKFNYTEINANDIELVLGGDSPDGVMFRRDAKPPAESELYKPPTVRLDPITKAIIMENSK